MAWTALTDGPWATELPGAWAGHLQLNTTGYTQGIENVIDWLVEPAATLPIWASSDVAGTRGDQSPDYSGQVHMAQTFLQDFRFRIYVVPIEQRLINPSINTDIAFVMWNTWPEIQTAASVTPSDALIIDPDMIATDTLQANEWTTTTYQIIDGEADIDEDITYVFDDETIVVNIFGSIASTFNIVPDIPVKETWEFLTDVLKNHNGDEQRIALRAKPRLSMDFTVDILDFADRRSQYVTLFRNMGIAATVPMYQHATSVTVAAAAGASKVFFDPAMTQMQQGDPIIVINPENDSFQLSTITTMDVDGANISGTFSDPLTLRMYVFPGVAMLLKDGSGINTYKVTGKMKVAADKVAMADLIRPGNSTTLTTLDSLPVMEKRIMAGTLSENFSRRTKVIDNETGIPKIELYSELHGQIEGVKKWEINRYDGTSEDYMRMFINTARGAQKAWLLPTWMPDLVLTGAVTQGDSKLYFETNDYINHFSDFATWQYLMIQYDALDPTYHTVSNVVAEADGTTSLVITPALALVAAAEDISMVSFLNRVRGDDRVVRIHYEQMTEYSWAIRTVDV